MNDKGHGRVEWGYYYQSSLPAAMKQLAKGWKTVTTIGNAVLITEL